MFDLKKAIADWKRSLRKFEAFEDGAIMELESHLLDEFDKLKASGMAAEEAFARAAAAVGRPEDVGSEYFKESNRSRLASPSWRKSRFSPGLFLNYLKVSWRKITRQKGYSFINIAGLALGMACGLLIMLWVLDELSYDRFHKNANAICRIETNFYEDAGKYHFPLTPFPLGPVLPAEIPEIKEFARIKRMGQPGLLVKNQVFDEWPMFAVDPSFLRMFSFPLIQGNARNALSGSTSLVISASTAKAIFGEGQALGRTITLFGKEPFTVTGVLQDIPQNSSLQFSLLIPFRFLEISGETNDNFTDNRVFTFVQLHSPSALRAANQKITGFIGRRIQSKATLELLPLTQLHLHEYEGYEESTVGRSVALFSIIAIFILLIGCTNFVNLSTARSAGRAREVGLRKVIGAQRWQLIRQFYGESLFFAFLSMLLAFAIASLALPAFGILVGKDLSWHAVGIETLVAILVGITVLTGLISGSYPAFFMSSFRPIQTLLQKHKHRPKALGLRRALVIFQFSLSAILLIWAGTISRQVEFMKNANMGWNREQVISIPLARDSRSGLDRVKIELAKTSGVIAMGAASGKPSSLNWSSTGFDWQGKDPASKIQLTYMGADEGFVDTLKLQLSEGRNFSKEFPADRSESFLINEELASIMGPGSAVGKSFSFWNQKGKIIGVLKNFHYQPLKEKIQPLVVCLADADWSNFLFLRLAPGKTAADLKQIKATWRRILPNASFRFQFLDDDFRTMYVNEEQTKAFLKLFMVLAVLIACLGLFGLISFSAEQRTKEIGIRKVLGASVPQIMNMLCREFLALIAVANMIAWPIAYAVVSSWLNDFAYRIKIPVSLFVEILFLSIFIGLLTVTWHALRAARANPVKSLRYE
ncbi:MAG: ABC transporter permease [Chrysiogenia bacterium]